MANGPTTSATGGEQGVERVSVHDVLLEVERGFSLTGDVSLTELRSSRWIDRLHKLHKMRLLHRNRTVGVLVDPELWQALESIVRDMLEDMVVEEQWGHRLQHVRRSADVAGPELLRLLQANDGLDAEP